MDKFEFSLGDIVIIDPVGEHRGPRGKVTGRIEYLGGDVGYIVSALSWDKSVVQRHFVSSNELTKVPAE